MHNSIISRDHTVCGMWFTLRHFHLSLSRTKMPHCGMKVIIMNGFTFIDAHFLRCWRGKIWVTEQHVDVAVHSDGKGEKCSIRLGGSNTIKQARRKGKTSCQRKCCSRWNHYIQSRFGVCFHSRSCFSSWLVQHFGKTHISCLGMYEKLDTTLLFDYYVHIIINMKLEPAAS